MATSPPHPQEIDVDELLKDLDVPSSSKPTAPTGFLDSLSFGDEDNAQDEAESVQNDMSSMWDEILQDTEFANPPKVIAPVSAPSKASLTAALSDAPPSASSVPSGPVPALQSRIESAKPSASAVPVSNPFDMEMDFSVSDDDNEDDEFANLSQLLNRHQTNDSQRTTAASAATFTEEATAKPRAPDVLLKPQPTPMPARPLSPSLEPEAPSVIPTAPARHTSRNSPAVTRLVNPETVTPVSAVVQGKLPAVYKSLETIPSVAADKDTDTNRISVRQGEVEVPAKILQPATKQQHNEDDILKELGLFTSPVNAAATLPVGRDSVPSVTSAPVELLAARNPETSASHIEVAAAESGPARTQREVRETLPTQAVGVHPSQPFDPLEVPSPPAPLPPKSLSASSRATPQDVVLDAKPLVAAVDLLPQNGLLNLSRKCNGFVPDNIRELRLHTLILSHNVLESVSILSDSIQVLDLSHNALVQIHGLSSLTRLRVVNLSHNRIARIENLQTTCGIRELHLGHNLLRNATGLERLVELRRLNLEYNNISAFKGLRPLSVNTKLTFLVLQGNPVTEHASFRSNMLHLFPQLAILDYTHFAASAQKAFYKAKRIPFFSSPMLSVPAFYTTSELQDGEERAQSVDPQERSPRFMDGVRGGAIPWSTKGAYRLRDMMRKVNLFKECDTSFIDALISMLFRRSFDKDEMLAKDGDFCEELLFVVKGQLEIVPVPAAPTTRLSGPRNTQLQVGAFIGEDTLLLPCIRGYRLVGSCEGEVLVLAKGDFESVLRTHPQSRDKIISAHAELIARQMERKKRPSPAGSFKPQTALPTSQMPAVMSISSPVIKRSTSKPSLHGTKASKEGLLFEAAPSSLSERPHHSQETSRAAPQVARTEVRSPPKHDWTSEQDMDSQVKQKVDALLQSMPSLSSSTSLSMFKPVQAPEPLPLSQPLDVASLIHDEPTFPATPTQSISTERTLSDHVFQAHVKNGMGSVAGANGWHSMMQGMNDKLLHVSHWQRSERLEREIPSSHPPPLKQTPSARNLLRPSAAPLLSTAGRSLSSLSSAAMSKLSSPIKKETSPVPQPVSQTETSSSPSSSRPPEQYMQHLSSTFEDLLVTREALKRCIDLAQRLAPHSDEVLSFKERLQQKGLVETDLTAETKPEDSAGLSVPSLDSVELLPRARTESAQGGRKQATLDMQVPKVASEPSVDNTMESSSTAVGQSSIDVNDWLQDVEEETTTTQLALSNLLESTARPESLSRSKLNEYREVFQECGLFLPYAIPDVVEHLLDHTDISSTDSSPVVRFKGALQRLDKTKQYLRLFFTALESESPASARVQKLRNTILESNVFSSRPSESSL
eukprot:GILK01012113.1.p1 GENE.GILK01012113.1~~GILK01012113.1.p1  ORF type:complete len:1537 (-),score=265.10 GILK01012113.1:77-4120(-)